MKILWKIQTDNMVVANELDILIVDRQKKKVAEVDVTSPNDS